ncbi:hypothetical protein BCD64_01125 [Nostoc sp. MBR 210]|nr:hypothetical protein BCD64_01125 [Nostoc sp. MBR 210]
MKDEVKVSNDESVHESALDKAVTPISPISYSGAEKQFISLLSYIAKLPIIKFAIVVAAVLCLVFILGKLINQYDLTSLCVGWNCTITQNPDNCSTKHLLSLGVGGAFGLVSGIGTALLMPAAGAIIAPAIAGLLIGAGIFGGSTFLLEFFIPC